MTMMLTTRLIAAGLLASGFGCPSSADLDDPAPSANVAPSPEEPAATAAEARPTPEPDGPGSVDASTEAGGVTQDVGAFWDEVGDAAETGFSGTRLYEYFEWPLRVTGETLSPEVFRQSEEYGYLVDPEEPIRAALLAAEPVAYGGEWTVSAGAEREDDSGDRFEYGAAVIIRQVDGEFRIVQVTAIG